MEQLALDVVPIRVHCFACRHVVERFDPDEAHDAMEQHYDLEHRLLIRSIAGS